MIKRLKASYMLYNFFHRKKLQHNARIYKKLGLRKWYFSPVCNKDFEKVDRNSIPKSDNITTVENTQLFNKLEADSQKSIEQFETQGYAIINSYLTSETVDAINNEIEEMLKQQAIDFKYRNKIMFAIHKSALLRSIGEDPRLIELLSALIQDKIKLFQSINFLTGSEQKTHSDSIHMTTFPLGGLLGVWIALEDIELDNGPLHYYPGSHSLPYYLNDDYDNNGNFLLIGKKGYTEYEKMLEKKIEELHIKKSVFTAKKGDLLIWHANLLHGGEPHTNKAKTRKSMVFHYFAVDRICYHEITQRPALMEY
ncbi:phytanoyl-CoA dioxygenase family protein [Pinibacter aurantiacus]|uniref:Phytanoyl-CoA dioxygenase family protein n=1 Tax=Pinibacter aurantiacus TaxID=2851599 RepID=A0A9E2SAC3_9BACT|nr:phytanoyl-CoA dioxygenase family protein [Pinibacter aurantiacus]MBV4358512.1 phytanoyl-CoA dioxygenase family protein [Pinibacter aurantiacus]